MPALGVLLLLDAYNHNITINGYDQTETINVDMVTDFPWEDLEVKEDADTVSVVDDGGTTYATFQK